MPLLIMYIYKAKCLKNNEIYLFLMYIGQVHDFRHANKYKLYMFSRPDRSAESIPVFSSFLSKN